MVGNEAIAALAGSAAIVLLLPIVTFLVLRRSMKLPLRNVFIGAAMFFLSALILESILHYFVLVKIPATSAWFKANAIGFAVYGALAAGLFEETGRFIGLKSFAKRVDGAGTPLSYGIGHGGLECMLVGLQIALNIYVIFLFNAGAINTLHLPQAYVDTLQESYAHLTWLNALYGGFERLSAFIFQLTFSLLVWRAIVKRNFIYYLLAVALHAGVDFPAALAQRKILPITIGELEFFYGALAAILLVLMIVLLRRNRQDPDSQKERPGERPGRWRASRAERLSGRSRPR